MHRMRRLIAIWAWLCLAYSCGTNSSPRANECVPGEGINCAIDSIHFGKIRLGMGIDTVEFILGPPYIFSPEKDRFPPFNKGRYSWNRYSGKAAIQNGAVDPSVYLETENGRVVSVKYTDGTTLLHKP